MSPSVFFGRRRASKTVYRYGRSGRLIESVTTELEPEWGERDRELALAVEDELAIRCGECGHPLDETTDPDPLTRWEVDRAHVVQCRACAAQDKFVATLSAADKARLHLMKIPVRRVRLADDGDDDE